jgi:DNA helicase-2/ATP-dependent DNA helicase PcrA
MADIVVIASAGSGKTTHLVDEASRLDDARILITTYTNENVQNIRDCLVERFGYIPKNITVCSWYSMLLAHGVRPYQNLVSGVGLSRSIALVDLPPAMRFVPKTNIDRYFFTQNGNVYRDRVSDFTCLADDKTNGLVIRRLEKIYTHLLIDELQDLAGYDLEFLEKLFRSKIGVIAVGDPRQATYATNNSTKNKAAARAAIVSWVSDKEKQGLVKIEERAESWRSNQIICDFADALYPTLPRSTSRNGTVTGHDGIFEIPRLEVAAYVAKYGPVVLRYSKAADTLGLPAMNIGVSKGRSFDRVLIFPTGPMKTYLKKRDLAAAGDLPKFYVAITRARYSVAFVI